MSKWPESVFVLTGAGISRESGIPTFRDADGIWARVRIEDVATPEAFARDPEKVLAFYNMRRRALLDPAVRPNAAHEALALLERELDGEVLVVTQNIDDLHERAGTRNLLHMHGELLKARCVVCAGVHDWPRDLTLADVCPACGGSPLRPHVVWFGEIPLYLEEIAEALARCDLFVSIGTSGAVYPAAGFVAEVAGRGVPRVELNLELSAGSAHFTHVRHGPATEVVPAFVKDLLEGRFRP
jgi:NAD-dependent deacetylase